MLSKHLVPSLRRIRSNVDIWCLNLRGAYGVAGRDVLYDHGILSFFWLQIRIET